ncbi:hydroxyacylglutathione hydrolase [Prosthecomicrobium hirschii]|uniref:Hydroxyacylglutathione hydrolase n=1 Tax=Prosthecodimorpha hirschii TaxID=665126 RepID=A0A0P6W5W5_9HYPH|nr:hydroxyacylglutathione hydrolase [Prosthecomicrobium hirschii]KPL53892.1 hydroxyacylglutathione hydrolase [Prosthecomicrobium hirschii]MCW1842999.1 hydroxyacylglutathione hydrolase [Prosthecomicrobium hirschii]TPQ52666.1 hydroxyacylglutathione hydrolase [Prosthecomicrobium hirschii]
MARLQIYQFACLSDNYGVLVHDPASGATASIDAPDEGPILRVLDETGWRLTDIWVTHKHHDHVGGVAGLKARFGLRVIGPRSEADQIPGLDVPVQEGDRLAFAGHEVLVLDTPGHTAGHIAYVLPDANAAFVGDTLFALGCGRVFEGSMADMWASLQKLRALPVSTEIYCGHEYTLSNARFAVSVDPDNAALRTRLAEIEKLRAEGLPTLPTSIAREIETNPFLRADDPDLAAALGMAGADPVAVFTRLREGKNQFRG